ncbi:hypothetical protein N9K06_01635, partial [Omnitrophica bacterium]|nr:hypothetical protein [Candidatus Omnitrophota bacterium]
FLAGETVTKVSGTPAPAEPKPEVPQIPKVKLPVPEPVKETVVEKPVEPVPVAEKKAEQEAVQIVEVPRGSSQDKLKRGYLNIILSPIELAHEWSKVKKQNTLVPSWVKATGSGAAKMSVRALAGVYEMATFWLPYPANFQPVVEPEFASDYFPKTKSKKRR